MIKSVSCALAVTFALAVSGSAFAATKSQSDTSMMKKCQGMSKSAMMKNKNCESLMKKYPDAMNGSGATSGSMHSGGAMKSGGAMSNGKPGDNSSGAGSSNMGGGATSK